MKKTFHSSRARQIHYLKIIGRLRHSTLTDLARAFKVSKPSVTAIVNHLFELGYVEKSQSENDLRVFTVRLTAKGERIVRVDEEAVLEFCSQTRSVLSGQELEELEFLIAKIISTIK